MGESNCSREREEVEVEAQGSGDTLEEEDCDGPPVQGYHLTELTLFILPYLLLTLTLTIIIIFYCRARLSGSKSDPQTDAGTNL